MFEKNETGTCKCGVEKLSQKIYCEDCANYWGSQISGKNLPFVNSNGSVEWMNMMHKDFSGKIGLMKN